MIRLKALGGAVLQRGETPVTGRAAQPHHLALAVFLAAAPGRSATRERVIAHLWPEHSPARGRHRLSVALHILRRGLGEDALTTFGDAITLNAVKVWTDVDSFTAAVGEGRLEEAVALYSGPFLDGFFVNGTPEFDRWVESERERLAGLYRVALERLIAEAEQRQDGAAAADWWRRLATHDPYSSPVALGLMRALATQGDVAGAVRYARAHTARVEAELELAPDPAVISLADHLATIAEARSDGPPAAPPKTPALAPLPPRRRRALFRAVFLVGGGGVALATAFAVRDRGAGPAPEKQPAFRSVIVLPFTGADEEPEDQELGGNLAGMVGATLAGVPDLRVHPVEALVRRTDTRRLARGLGVEAVVDGELRREGTRLLTTVRLLDGATGKVRWSGSFDRPTGDLRRLRDELSFSIADALRLQITPYVPKVYTENRRAYDRFLLGVYSHRRFTAENIWKALQLYREAYEEDPGFALAHAIAGNAYIDLGVLGLAPEVAFARAREHVLEALALDSTLAEGNAALAYILIWGDRDFPAGERLLRQTLMLYPTLPQARAWYGMYALLVRGWREAGVRNLRLALDADPLNAARSRAVELALYWARRYAEVEAQSRVTWSLDSEVARSLPDSPLAAAFRELGRYEESVAEYRALQERTGGPAPAGLALTYARMGKIEDARAILREVEGRAETLGTAPLTIARIYANLGEPDRAFEWLDRTVRAGSWLVLSLGTDPALDPLRSDPRFERLLARIGLGPPDNTPEPQAAPPATSTSACSGTPSGAFQSAIMMPLDQAQGDPRRATSRYGTIPSPRTCFAKKAYSRFILSS